MLSPTISAPPADGSNSPANTSSSRRRGLSYLRSLSSHSHASADQPRTSPRSFFQRSSSYNDQNKKLPNRRRSASKPDEPTAATIERATLSRVTSAGNVTDPPEDTSSGEDGRQSRVQETDTENMARHRHSSARVDNGATEASSTAADTSASLNGEEQKLLLPMIRLFPHQDMRNGRQSLNFSPVSRTLPSENAIIRVGRYSEREGLPVAQPAGPSDSPVGFKSKVVSRKHCEFTYSDGQWRIRDVASSSGTFLNHIRLSPPNQESKPFPIKDGDIVQLGIDFRGGEEMIFRCVKIRIECNRSWQKKPNTFNKTRRAQLLGLAKDQPAANNSGECSICLGSVLPCQSLFVAPCAHVWHYKCIRPMLEGRQSQYPQFQCPNCRAYTDLEADVDVADDDMEEWMENANDNDQHLNIDQTDRPAVEDTTSDHTAEPVLAPDPAENHAPASSELPAPAAASVSLLARRAAANPTSPIISTVGGLDMPSIPTEPEIQVELDRVRTSIESPNVDQIIAGEGPLTPRNNAGPFIFDGSGGTRRAPVPGLGGVAEETV